LDESFLLEQIGNDKASRVMSLVREIEGCLLRTGLKETRFGRVAVNDPRLVRDLRRGRKPGPGTVEKVRATIARLDS